MYLDGDLSLSQPRGKKHPNRIEHIVINDDSTKESWLLVH